jgi:hypothetical protein
MSDDFLVRDDFITPAVADDLEKLMFGNFFPWYFLDNTTTKQGEKKWFEVECPMHVHNLYFEGSVNNPGYQQILNQFHLDPGILIRMKANMLMPRRFEFRHTPYHVDRLDPHYTIVYYVNDADGATLLESRRGRQKIAPKKGRVVLFDGALKHANYLPTRGPRCVINFNFRAWPLPGPAPFPATAVAVPP